VVYDPKQIAYEDLLIEFWTMHDPTSLNRQGGDVGSQYRSAIFTTSNDQSISAVNTRDIYEQALREQGYGEICTEIVEAEQYPYWPAEEYHQRYLEKNPNGYDCHSSTGIAFPRS
jgi:peptide-methionine (S)-S-oxide reductase